jgi:hypothetical protein
MTGASGVTGTPLAVTEIMSELKLVPISLLAFTQMSKSYPADSPVIVNYVSKMPAIVWVTPPSTS